jgi:transposase
MESLILTIAEAYNNSPTGRRVPQLSPDCAPSKPSSRQHQPARSSGFATSHYAERNLVERFFNAIKHYRGICNTLQKTARNFLAGLHLFCALTWLK